MTRPERIFRVAHIDCRLVRHDWSFARDEAERVEAHWTERKSETPALFDGRVLLSTGLAADGDVLRGACFETGFKSFLAWRDFGCPETGVCNFFGMPALRAADGAFMLGEMSPRTANAGRLYFPAGTPEPGDLVEGRVDLEGSVLRELEEETGLEAGEVAFEPGWTIVEGPRPLVACMKVARARLDAAALQARLAAFNATLAAPELTRLVPVRTTADLDPARMPDFMLSYLRAALGEGQAR